MRVSTKVKVRVLAIALRAKRAEIVARNAELQAEIDLEEATLQARQIEALEDAISAALDDKVVRARRDSRDRPADDEYLLELPERPWRHMASVERYDDALRILDLADPDDLVAVPQDGDYAHLLR